MIGGEGCSKEYMRINDTDRAKERIYAGTVQTGVAVGLPPRSERRRVRFPVSAPNTVAVARMAQAHGCNP